MLRKKISMAVALAVAASLLLAGAVVAGGDRNHDRIPDRWEKRHGLSLKVKQHRRDQDSDGLKNRGEWKAHLDPRDDDTDDDGVEDGDENAGTIESYTDGVLTLKLAGGGTLSATVTEDTEVECDDDASDDHGEDDGENGDGHHGDGEHGDGEHGDEDDGDDDARAATGDEDDGEACAADALTAGTTVLEAELKIRGGEAVWEELELLKP